MEKESKIYVAGHKGLVGSSIIRRLKEDGYYNIITIGKKSLDLTHQIDVDDFIRSEKPHYVFLAAAKVGGIYANSTLPADFMYSNLTIQTNIINSCYRHNVNKLLFLGSSCIYPKHCQQPIKENSLLSGRLEPTNEPYAIAKIAGIRMCQSYNKQYKTNFISCMPTNLYGPGDNYDSNYSHVLPALINKIHTAKKERSDCVYAWGTGNAIREFLYIDDMANACVFLMNNYNDSGIINVGSGEEVSIRDLSNMISKIVGYSGIVKFDQTKPDGTPRKLVDCSKIYELGWHHNISLNEGIRKTYEHFKLTHT